MSMFTKVGLALGLAVTAGFPLGMLYVSLAGYGVDPLLLSVVVTGCFLGVFLLGISLSARTRRRY